MNRPNVDCPKAMTYGPCGGVGGDDSCEADGRRCPFIGRPITPWNGAEHQPRLVEVPRVIVDHRPTGDEAVDQQILGRYRELGTAVLLGDHLDDPHSFDRVATARKVTRTGVTAVATITARNRSREERNAMLDGFADAEVMAVLCVTGDHPGARGRPHDGVDFTSEGTQLANDARCRGAVVAVAESPAAPPAAARTHRLRAKEAAGADFAILNHGGTPIELLEFARAARNDLVTLPLIAPVAVITDLRSVEALAQFPGVRLSSEDVHRVLEAPDPEAAGVDLAIRTARSLLASGLVAGVNLSGVGTGRGPAVRSRIMQQVARALKA